MRFRVRSAPPVAPTISADSYVMPSGNDDVIARSPCRRSHGHHEREACDVFSSRGELVGMAVTTSRNRRLVRLVAGLLTALLVPAMASAEPAYTWDKELFVKMRDGVNLSTDVLLPKKRAAKVPAVLVRTPYDKD